jgi:hypothetical protein
VLDPNEQRQRAGGRGARTRRRRCGDRWSGRTSSLSHGRDLTRQLTGACWAWRFANRDRCEPPRAAPVVVGVGEDRSGRGRRRLRRAGRTQDCADPQVRSHFQQRPRQDSNLRTRLRRPMLYPLSYEGREGQGSAPVLGGRTGIASRPRLNRAGLWLLSDHGRARFGHVVARNPEDCWSRAQPVSDMRAALLYRG